MVRYRYEAKQIGIICISNTWHERLAYMDCSRGGAQKAFDDLCRQFALAGWELEKRVFDRRYMRREWLRWEIEIRDVPPQDEPEHDGREFMAGIVDHHRERE